MLASSLHYMNGNVHYLWDQNLVVHMFTNIYDAVEFALLKTCSAYKNKNVCEFWSLYISFKNTS